jgi:NTE family protein
MPALVQEESRRLPNPRRDGIGLCLSGGGFRAALFHLGALRRLDELGVLSRTKTISTVSGGSIASAFLADRLVKAYPEGPPTTGRWFPDWKGQVSDPFRAVLRRDLRTGPILARLWPPWNWLDPGTSVRELADLYRRYLTKLTLAQLPPRPRFIFCATDLVFGVNWVFERERLGDYQAGYCSPPPADWPLARAVAASSCFPPIFSPLPVRMRPRDLKRGAYQARDRDRLVSRLSLSDGGVYDLYGLEPVWKDHETILVSDGGGPFDFRVAGTPLARIFRYVAIVENQAIVLRRRWLLASLTTGVLRGAYWGVASAVSSYRLAGATGYSKDFVLKYLATIRTDLDGFTPAEMAVLENHGYLLADAALRKYVLPTSPDSPPPAPAEPPHPEWMNEELAGRAHLGSASRFSVRRLWQRWFPGTATNREEGSLASGSPVSSDPGVSGPNT